MACLRQLVDQVLLILGLQSNVSRHSGKKKIYIYIYIYLLGFTNICLRTSINKPFLKKLWENDKAANIFDRFSITHEKFLKMDD